MRYNILFGGKAGQGPNILSDLVAKALIKQGYYVFYSRDYQSLIRGGHNFNVLTFSENYVNSNDNQIDILIALDERTLKEHKEQLKNSSIILSPGHNNMYYAGSLFKILGIDFSTLDNFLKELKRRYSENIKEAKLGYNEEKQSINLKKLKPKNLDLMNGSQALALGSIASGLDIYYGYPMTPATPILGELANTNGKHLVVELENEIAVANAGIGSCIAGSKVMVGTSGGGLDLMSENLSLCGIAEIPLVFYLAQRPGPGTGVPTYTSQADLKMVLGAGHGEFPRIVLAPGRPGECYSLVSEALYLSHKYKVPSILISDKHLAEAKFFIPSLPVITKSVVNMGLKKYSSYEIDDKGLSTESPELTIKNTDKRLAKLKLIEKEIDSKFKSFKIYGDKNSKKLIISWGSTKGAILDYIQDNPKLKFLQIRYIEPFTSKLISEIKKYSAENIIVIENNATSPLSSLIAEKTQILIPNKNKVLKYDARPFTLDDLKVKLDKLIK